MDDSRSINAMGDRRSLHDRLQHLFKTGFTAIDIAEPLMTFDADARGPEVQRLMHDTVAYDWEAIVQMSRRLDRMLARL